MEDTKDHHPKALDIFHQGLVDIVEDMAFNYDEVVVDVAGFTVVYIIRIVIAEKDRTMVDEAFGEGLMGTLQLVDRVDSVMVEGHLCQIRDSKTSNRRKIGTYHEQSYFCHLVL